MKSPLISYITLFFGVFALSTSAIFVKLADAPATITAFYRMFFAAVMLLPFLLVNKKNRQELRLLSKKQWGFGLLSGVFLAAHYVLWFQSLNYTSVASSTVIVTLQPLFSIIGGYFLFKERFSKGAVMGCLVAIAGSIVIGWQDFQISGQALFGDILAFVAAGVITAYFFVGQHVRKMLSLVPYSIIGYASSALFLSILSFSQQVSFVNYSSQTWWSFIGLAFIATILGQTIFNWLLKWLSTSVISMGILGETIGTCILAYFILDEVISLQQGIGILLILIGLALFLLKQRKSE
ncbi:DMT family transporter [Aneurinibacillus aneurinilyticus]|uniref:DMT family transporter n=2 Tax=Aneurinibacillus aneurinilyticus TaxID=1391 RepID=A0A848CLU9_ANEAE|nr:DMT family transporter [Aneurinibacillus aneurinilyticus]ERI07352.1 putative membrane protein [Aneurinibacillus aneurinilyticus ATCC 12856]MED0709380.1 DMT family transporter [Aneurinibacillus aneurinilyticus]MED0726002.1 DMT family transporter [Aneurinibacillus aneurinilyticus]MED0733908.1 DMT family transporter [Aneurinibacillus aneurinilyticus]MED0743966.1 DMT family transporter [Aneurinibacillus aneurinilyticus]